MNRNNTLFLLLVIIFLCSCAEYDRKLTITAYLPGSDSHRAALALKEVLYDEGWDLTIVAQSHQEGIESLRRGEIDLAITSNEISINAKNLRTLIPLYHEVLISLIREDSPILEAKNYEEIFEIIASSKPKIVFSNQGSYSCEFARRLLNEQGFTEEMYDAIYFPKNEDYKAGRVETVRSENPDLIYLVSNMDSELIGEMMELGYLFRTIENQAENLDVSHFSSFALKIPRSFPVVIPKYAFSAKQTEPVVTLGLFTSIISNKALDEEMAYDLVHDIIKAQPELIRYNTNLYEMSEDFDRRLMNFQIHAGAKSYFDRAKPSVFERYAELAGVFISLVVVLATLLATLNRIVKQRQKNRIDIFYLDVQKARNNPDPQEGLAQLTAIQEKAFSHLINEKIMADSSFVVFMQLLAEARIELREKTIAG